MIQLPSSAVFFAAIDALIAMKKFRGKATYCRQYGIDRANFNAQKKDYCKGFFQVSWLVPLIKDFNVSSNWILVEKEKCLGSNNCLFLQKTCICSTIVRQITKY